MCTRLSFLPPQLEKQSGGGSNIVASCESTSPPRPQAHGSSLLQDNFRSISPFVQSISPLCLNQFCDIILYLVFSSVCPVQKQWPYHYSPSETKGSVVKIMHKDTALIINQNCGCIAQKQWPYHYSPSETKERVVEVMHKDTALIICSCISVCSLCLLLPPEALEISVCIS